MSKYLYELENDKLVTLGRGKIISKIEMNANPGNYPVYSSSATEDGKFGEYGEYMFEDERITWSIDGGGRLFYRNKHKYSVTNVCGWMKVNDTSILDTKYLYYDLYYQWKFLKFDYTIKAHPSTIRKIYKVNIIPIVKQKKIISSLDNIINSISNENIKLLIIDELIKSRFIEMFGDPITNSKKLSTKTLPELGEFGRGVSKHRPRNAPELLGGKYPLIQTGEISNSGLYIYDYKDTYSEIGFKQSKMWKEGTLCITIAANIAKTSILTFDACFPDSVVGFNANNDTSNIFIHYWFDFFQAILEEQAPSAAQKNINIKILSELKVIVPKKEEIDKFDDFVEHCDKLKFVCQMN